MKRILKRRPVGRTLLVLLITGMTVGAFISSEMAWGQGYNIKPPLGQEGDILYSIPKGGTDVLTPGTSVSRLPSSCTKVSRRDTSYYSCEGNIYLQPYFRGSKVRYMVIEKPR